MTSNTENFEVFQNIVLRGQGVDRPAIRAALHQALAPPWQHAEANERRLSANRGNEGQMLAFKRLANDDGIKSATLYLCSKGDGYELAQIIPFEGSELSHREHNEILQDFELSVAAPAAVQAGFIVERTTPQETLDNWVSRETAQALRDFSRSATKSTGSSHPLDERRWFNFLIAAHGDKDSKLDTQKLTRWLVEAENWSDDKANELVIEYEFGLNLLREYDKRRSQDAD